MPKKKGKPKKLSAPHVAPHGKLIYAEYVAKRPKRKIAFEFINPTQRAVCAHAHQADAYVCDRCQYLLVVAAGGLLLGVPVNIACPRPLCGGTMHPSYRKCLDCGHILRYY